MPDTIFAPAKINVWLRIFAPDDTGYHPLDTLFCALELADHVTIERTDAPTTLEVLNADVGPTERNLAWRAADEFFRATGLAGGAAIRLDKRIPAGAGLGGGSSDAAAVLRALNDLHDGVLPMADLAAMAARLGSDVAFFLCGAPLAHATGRGEVLQPLPALPRAPVIVLAPAFGIATADAYRWLDEARAFSEPQPLRAVPRDWEGVAAHAANDFERVVFARHPTLARLKSELLDSGALIALLSGSGSTLFGVYGSDAERDGALATLEGTVRASQAVIISTNSRVVQWQDSGLWLR
jgi:4-diphosphocytidyl-2-C-methyl-D-erythritol kinase